MRNDWILLGTKGIPNVDKLAVTFYKNSIKIGKPKMADIKALLTQKEIVNYLSPIGANAINKMKIKGVDVSKINPMYLSFVGALEVDVVMAVNTLAYDTDLKLYTRNEAALRTLAKKGFIVNDVEKAIKSLSGEKAKEGLNEGTTAVVRLDIEEVVPEIKIKAVAVRNRVGLLNKDGVADTIYYPMTCVRASVSVLEEMFDKFEYIKIARLQEKGIKEIVVTTNRKSLENVYKAAGVEDLANKIKQKWIGTLVGYDGVTQKYIVYDAESSIYTRGQFALRIHDIKGIQSVTLDDIDKTVSNVDLSNISRIFEKRLKVMPKGDLARLARDYLVLEEGRKYTATEIRELLKAWGEVQGPDAIYKLMKVSYAVTPDDVDKNVTDKVDAKKAEKKEERVQVFGDVDKHIDNYAKTQPKETKNFTDMERPYTLEGIKRAFSTRVLRIIFKTKSGDTSVVVGTNNEEILRRAYRGKGYIMKLESSGRRLREARNKIVDALNDGTAAQNSMIIGDIIEKYSIMSLLAETGELQAGDINSTVLNAIDKAIDNLDAKTANRTNNPNNIRLRSIRAESAEEYYKTVNFDAIVSVQESAEVKLKH